MNRGARTPRLWAVVGATGTGKSELSLDLAQALIRDGCPAEIVNADAMQLYRGMDIGTAKLPFVDRRGVPHHLLDVLNVDEDAAVARYQEDARRIIAELHDRGSDAILVGGSGLYVSSVLFDFRFPPRDAGVRRALEDELDDLGPGPLFERLRSADPATAARMDPRNGRRIVRALEVIAAGATTHGAALPERLDLWRPATVIGLTVPRADLVQRLDARVDRMWRSGLLDEVRRLRAEGLERGTTAPRAIGYAQALAQLDDRVTEEAAVEQTRALTRRYARRQVSWFRRYRDVHWYEPGAAAADELVARI